MLVCISHPYERSNCGHICISVLSVDYLWQCLCIKEDRNALFPKFCEFLLLSYGSAVFYLRKLLLPFCCLTSFRDIIELLKIVHSETNGREEKMISFVQTTTNFGLRVFTIPKIPVSVAERIRFGYPGTLQNKCRCRWTVQ
jgi:hypothetical protein